MDRNIRDYLLRYQKKCRKQQLFQLSFENWIAKRRIMQETPEGIIVCNPEGLVDQPELIQFYNE